MRCTCTSTHRHEHEVADGIRCCRVVPLEQALSHYRNGIGLMLCPHLHGAELDEPCLHQGTAGV